MKLLSGANEKPGENQKQKTTRIVSFECAIADSSSAIKISGGEGDAVKLLVDCYVGSHIEQLANLRGKTLMCVIGPVADMIRLTEFIDKGND